MPFVKCYQFTSTHLSLSLFGRIWDLNVLVPGHCLSFYFMFACRFIIVYCMQIAKTLIILHSPAVLHVRLTCNCFRCLCHLVYKLTVRGCIVFLELAIKWFIFPDYVLRDWNFEGFYQAVLKLGYQQQLCGLIVWWNRRSHVYSFLYLLRFCILTFFTDTFQGRVFRISKHCYTAIC